MSGGPEDARTLVALLRERAASQGEQHAFSFLPMGREPELTWTYADLDRRARAIATLILDRGAAGETVLLLYPSGLDYVAAFFGCLYAGAIAVPVYPPRPGRSARRLQAVVADAGARVALTTNAVRELVRQTPEGEGALEWHATDGMDLAHADGWHDPDVAPETIAFLQYTSGSTATPKGVMLTHANLLQNERMMGAGFETDDPEFLVVGWLPLYHDMGLIGNVLQPIWRGRPCVLMAPESFMMRPFRWLDAITRFRATVSGGPNFAYDLCVKKITAEQRATLSLSHWRVAYNGAEPIDPVTLSRFAEAFAPCGFRPEAFVPCYGLAEATLFVTGAAVREPVQVRSFSASALQDDRVVPPRREDDARELVACGHAWLGTEVAIVDPETRTRRPERAPAEPEAYDEKRVGEIWVRGPCIALGYWNRPDATDETFAARLADEPEGAAWLRTGDLGFVHDGQTFVTGRLKDLVIVGGRNFYPQDLERVAEAAHPALRPGCCAAFARGDGDEAVIVVVEARANELATGGAGAVIDAIRSAVFDEEGLAIADVVLIRQGTIPKTSSGKIQRRATRALYASGRLERI